MTNFVERSFLNNRRTLVMRNPQVFGLEAVLAVRGSAASDRESATEWTLWLVFLPQEDREASAVPKGLQPENLQITLGRYPATAISIVSILDEKELDSVIADLPAENLHEHASRCVVAVRILSEIPATGPPEDAPVYTLTIRGIDEIDRFFSSALFTFGKNSRELLAPLLARPAETIDVPEIDYLNKDYESFRSQMLDNMSLFVPTWKERNPADLGVTIVEALAYAADYLSYYQDAAATEAYLETARRRISVARHARLLGYRLSEGCNARVWVQVKIEYEQDGEPPEKYAADFHLPVLTELLTYSGRFPGAIDRRSQDYESALEQGADVFHTLEPIRLYPEHNRFEIYTWGSDEFTLEQGATAATLRGHWEKLSAGDILIFEQRMSLTPNLGGAPDPRKRCALRLKTDPRLTYDPTNPGSDAESAQSDRGMEITEIEWFAEDALPFSFPISTVRQSQVFRPITVARGNIVLADHGKTVVEELPAVRKGQVYRPIIRTTPLTWSVGYRPKFASRRAAGYATDYNSDDALPEIYLIEHDLETISTTEECADHETSGRLPSGFRWSARRDLLTSGPFARDFVVETEEDGVAGLRFGDGRQGEAPKTDSKFTAVYRLGNGPKGNVGANSIRHVVLTDEMRKRLTLRKLRLLEAKNHLAGRGGVLRESTEHGRLTAPQMIVPPLSLQRCVIADDYVNIAQLHPLVRDAAAEEIWTGTWPTTALYLRRQDFADVDAGFIAEMQAFFKPYLLCGREVSFRNPDWAPIDILLNVWIAPDSSRSLAEATAAVMGSETLLDLFRPDAFDFGQSVYLSDILSRVASVPAVDRVDPKIFKRWGRSDHGELQAGEISIGTTEIAQLANDHHQPQKGLLTIRIDWMNAQEDAS